MTCFIVTASFAGETVKRRILGGSECAKFYTIMAAIVSFNAKQHVSAVLRPLLKKKKKEETMAVKLSLLCYLRSCSIYFHIH